MCTSLLEYPFLYHRMAGDRLQAIRFHPKMIIPCVNGWLNTNTEIEIESLRVGALIEFMMLLLGECC